MRRTAHRLLVLALVLAVAGCGTGPRAVPLEDLAMDPDAFHEDEVSVAGHVRAFGEEEGATELHYVIEDPDRNRVRLVPDEVAAEHVDRLVRVTGRFTFNEEVGRILEVDEIEPAS